MERWVTRGIILLSGGCPPNAGRYAMKKVLGITILSAFVVALVAETALFALGKTGEFRNSNDFQQAASVISGAKGKSNSWQIGIAYFF